LPQETVRTKYGVNNLLVKPSLFSFSFSLWVHFFLILYFSKLLSYEYFKIHCRFTYKVVIRIEGEASTVLECFGYPKPKKKTAAEHAAEGALWYLKHLGYFPIKKVKRKK